MKITENILKLYILWVLLLLGIYARVLLTSVQNCKHTREFVLGLFIPVWTIWNRHFMWLKSLNVGSMPVIANDWKKYSLIGSGSINYVALS